MADYRLLTIWRIEAPLAAVYSAIQNSLGWPDWWPGVQKVEQVTAGDADGIDNVRRYFWKGTLPYRIVFDIRATRIENLVAIEGTAEGDLDGIGRWHFSRQGRSVRSLRVACPQHTLVDAPDRPVRSPAVYP